MSKSFKSLRAQPSFQANVGVVIPGGEPDEVALTFIYKDRDELNKVVKADEKLVEALNKRANSTMAQVLEYEHASLSLIVSGWEFEEPFTKENVIDFLRHNRGFNASAWSTYFAQYTPAKQGN